MFPFNTNQTIVILCIAGTFILALILISLYAGKNEEVTTTPTTPTTTPLPTGPVLRTFSIDPSSINTFSIPQTITVSGRISGSGRRSKNSLVASEVITYGTVTFDSPGGSSSLAGFFNEGTLTSGDSIDGMYEYDITLPIFSEQGSWTVSSISIVHPEGSTTYSTEDLASNGFVTGFAQTGPGDIDSPTIASLSLSTTSIDTFSSDQTITVTANIVDDLVGNAGAGYNSSRSQIWFKSPGGTRFVSALLDPVGATLLSGDTLDGVYTYDMILPRYSEQGIWSIDYILLVDQIGNTSSLNLQQAIDLNLDVSFEQTGLGDISPPVMSSLSLSTTSIDTFSSEQTITVTASIVDDLAGNAGAGYNSSRSRIGFKSPGGTRFVSASLDPVGAMLISGDTLDGIYTYDMILPRYSEQGVWTIDYILLVDQVGNTSSLTLQQAIDLNLDVSFEQTGLGDIAPPVMSSLSLSTTSIDTFSSDQTITVTANIVDDLVGNAGSGYNSSRSRIGFKSPGGTQFVSASLDPVGAMLISGDTLDGIYTYDMILPRYSEQGVWTIDYILLVDQAGNTSSLTLQQAIDLNLNVSFEQTGAGDIDPPTITELSVSPSSVNTFVSSQTVTVTARILDNSSGNAGAGYNSSRSRIGFKSPVGSNQFVSASLDPVGAMLISGDTLDGIYTYDMTIPMSSATGTWTIDYILLVDQAGNSSNLNREQAETLLGVDVSFVIV
jgi:hypothetical protein